jgi:pseudouridine-5'-phosphate glycosidase
MEPYITQATQEAHAQGIRGKAITPFLLCRINELTGGEFLRAQSRAAAE